MPVLGPPAGRIARALLLPPSPRKAPALQLINMADDWEDWEAEDFVPPPPPTAVAAPKAGDEYETAGQALLAKMSQVDESKFADEDAEEDEPEDTTLQKVRSTSVCRFDAGRGAIACPRSDAHSSFGPAEPAAERKALGQVGWQGPGL